MSVPNQPTPYGGGFNPNSGHGIRDIAYLGGAGQEKRNIQKCNPNNTHNIILAFAVFFNNAIYLIYNYLFWVIFKHITLKLVEKKFLIMPVNDNLVFYCLVSFLSTYIWGNFISQGFEADPFSNVIPYIQKKLGKDEMIYKIIGNLFSGIPLGYTHKLIGYYLGYTFEPLRDKIFHAISSGLLSVYKSFFTIFFWSWLPNPLKRYFVGLANLILQPSKSCSFFPFSRNQTKDLHLSLSTLIDVALIEFIASFIVYLSLVISIQNSEPKHMWHLINATKRMVTFIGYTLLSPISDGPIYNASVIIGLALGARDLNFLIVKVLANLLAAIASAKVFTPPKTFIEKVAKPHEWPKTFLGNLCANLEIKINNRKSK